MSDPTTEVTISLDTLFVSADPISRVSQQPFPAAMTFRVVPFFRQIEQHVSVAVEARNRIYEQHNVRDPQTGTVVLPKDPEPRQALLGALEELAKETIEVSVPQSLTDFMSGTHPACTNPALTLTPHDLGVLRWIATGQDDTLTTQETSDVD